MPSRESSVASSSRLSPQVVRRGVGSTSSRRNSSTRTSPEQHRVPVGPPPALSPSLPRPSRVGSFATASPMPFQQLGSRRRPREESVTQSEESSEDEEQGIFSTTTAPRRHRQSAKRHRVAIPVTSVEDDDMDSSTQDEEPPDPGPSRGRQQAARPISRVLQQQTAQDATDSSTQDEESSTEHETLVGPSSSRRSRVERRGQPPNAPRANVEPIVIGSSDEEEEDADAEMRTLEPTTAVRRSTASHAGPVSSGFMVERIVRGLPPFAPQPVMASGSTDSLEIVSATIKDKDKAAPPGQLRKLQASPPRRRPPPIAHPLLSTYTCPICLCAPFPNAVATPCGHVFCSECLFEALQHPIKQKETERREQASAFASIPTINRLGGFIGAGVAQAMGIAGYGGPGGASRAAGHGQNMAAALGLSGAPAPPTSIHLTLDSQGNTISSSSTTRGTAASPSAANPMTTSSSTANQQQAPAPAPPQKLDPLVGPCPVCRAVIPGGFVAASLPANKRSAFGLELKIGKPIDDPRREEIQKR